VSDSTFVLGVKADSTVLLLDISAVPDAQLVQAGRHVCAQLSAIPQPTFADLQTIVERDITPLVAGAHNVRAPRDNGPVVLAYGVPNTAVKYLCPDNLGVERVERRRSTGLKPAGTVPNIRAGQSNEAMSSAARFRIIVCWYPPVGGAAA
jgi:hypothetical protein